MSSSNLVCSGSSGGFVRTFPEQYRASLCPADNQYNGALSNLKAIAFKITKVESEKNPLPISALFLELLQRQLT
jgi:hypothetical protein